MITPMRSVFFVATLCGVSVLPLAGAQAPVVKPVEPTLKVAYVAGMESPPAVVRRAAPVYPQELRAKGVQGTALVDARIDSMGRVVSVELVKATRPEFGERALEAARAWSFQPAMAQGKAIGSRVRLPFDFVMPEVAAMERR